ncbi:hypothetical protein ACIP5Y_33175 [Nocardia sp. NPDC088792]|uniref:hypothetical protein n=1 Tax=Nocardia sp. NPDC088792 TaxID=3364332 RepID=UPI0038144F5C
MDWMDRCVGNRVGRALAESGIGTGEVARKAGIRAAVFADRMIAPATFTVDELVLIAVALDRNPVDLLPDARCLPDAGCDVCLGRS